MFDTKSEDQIKTTTTKNEKVKKKRFDVFGLAFTSSLPTRAYIR